MKTGDEPSPVLLTSITESIATRLLVGHSVEAPTCDPAGALAACKVKRVRDYVREHLDEALDVAELADIVGLGVSHFTRLFKEATGYSPYQYVLRQRVWTAQNKLENTERPIAKIALDAGFSSQSHLTRRFKEVVGMPPGQYRKMVSAL